VPLIVRLLAVSEVKPGSEVARWGYWQTTGKPAVVAGQWRVEFIQGGPVLPKPREVTQLASWSSFDGENVDRFAGTARYRIVFNAPHPHDGPWMLDLGSVAQSARIRINGQDYGTRFTPPDRVAVGSLKPTGNVLEVEVTSVAANRIRDLDRRGVPWRIFHDINFMSIAGKPFDASAWPLTDCGLLGPVTLQAAEPLNVSPEKAR